MTLLVFINLGGPCGTFDVRILRLRLTTPEICYASHIGIGLTYIASHGWSREASHS